jgi:hypothetical protein
MQYGSVRKAAATDIHSRHKELGKQIPRLWQHLKRDETSQTEENFFYNAGHGDRQANRPDARTGFKGIQLLIYARKSGDHLPLKFLVQYKPGSQAHPLGQRPRL